MALVVRDSSNANGIKGWILPRRSVSLQLLVHASRSGDPYIILLLRFCAVRRVLWATRRRDCEDGRSGRIRGVSIYAQACRLSSMFANVSVIRWRWIFLLEGIVTVVLGVSCFFLLIDSPALSTRWLDPEEIRFLELQRYIKDGGKFQEEKAHFRWKDLKMVLCNWRLYMQAYILLCISACSYGTSLSDANDLIMLTRLKGQNSPCPRLRRAWASPTPMLSS